mmetsp:Transcript_29441/g.73955  ORF Transcript_29441/g.73955 Transcript_29441/m.73955 type:complete len:131 (-) Transcript_29441:405-797(-)
MMPMPNCSALTNQSFPKMVQADKEGTVRETLPLGKFAEGVVQQRLIETPSRPAGIQQVVTPRTNGSFSSGDASQLAQIELGHAQTKLALAQAQARDRKDGESCMQRYHKSETNALNRSKVLDMEPNTLKV